MFGLYLHLPPLVVVATTEGAFPGYSNEDSAKCWIFRDAEIGNTFAELDCELTTVLAYLTIA
jgi:hypothetical protein